MLTAGLKAELVTCAAFHGTSRTAAERIAKDGFRPSNNDYDWLGDGIYFFQDAPLHAREFAEKKFREPVAVIRATIVLKDCIDLLDIGWWEALRSAYQELERKILETGGRLPRQTARLHRLDGAIVNYCVETLRLNGGMTGAVRAAFTEAEPLFEGSAICSRSHVQIAIRDPALIQDLDVIF